MVKQVLAKDQIRVRFPLSAQPKVIHSYLAIVFKTRYTSSIRLENKYLTMATEAYCVKCKAKSTMKSEEVVTMKTGRQATQGPCAKCGTKMFRIMGGAAKK